MTESANRTVVITGASSGIGLGIARTFLNRGYNVVANGRDSERLLQAANRELEGGERLLLAPGDIADPKTAEHLFAEAEERFGAVDVLVNNAGIFNAKPVTDYTVEEIDALVQTNLKGLVYATQRAARHMIRRGKGGHIINISASIALQPTAKVPASVPILIKGGVNEASRALAIELAPHRIKVAAVAPGIIDTPLYTPDMHEFLRTLQPLSRLGTVDEVAQAVLYLAEAEYTTGVVLPVDGGMSAGTW